MMGLPGMFDGSFDIWMGWVWIVWMGAEELNWHATSAEALRTRLADVLRATAAEKRRGSEALAEEVRRKQTLQANLARKTVKNGGISPGNMEISWG